MTEYYQHRDLSVRFDVFKEGEDVTPVSSKVAIYDPDKEYIPYTDTKISGNEVSCVLPGKLVEETGKYVFVFDVRVRPLGSYTHIVKAQVKKLPVPAKKGK